jgi:arsenite-transporting ATPase
VLSIPLPLVEREEVHLHRSVFDELIVRIGNWKRNISLPLGLARLDISAARYEGDFLNIYFAIEPGVPPSEDELKPTRWQSLRARLRGK